MSNKILCEGCGKVYPLWIAADAKPANCSECGAQVKQRQAQPVIQPSPIEPVAAAPTKQINWGLIAFNAAIIGTAFFLIIAVIGLGIFLATRDETTVATEPTPTPQLDSSPSPAATSSADDADATQEAEQAPAQKAEPVEEEVGTGEGSIASVLDEESLQQAVGLVQLAMSMETANDPIRYYQTLYKTVSANEFKRTYNREDQAYYEDKLPKISGEQLVTCGGAGTCFLVTADGFAITNFHVIDDYLTAKSQRRVYSELSELLTADAVSPEIFVYLDGAPHSAEVVYNSTDYDFAILKIDGISNAPFFQLASTEHISKLTTVTVLGYPGSARLEFNREEALQNQKNQQSRDPRNWFKDSDLVYVATRGEISKVSERGNDGLIVQHTAKIDSGNSGGPLVTNDGIVLGINTWSAIPDEVGNAAASNYSLSMHSLVRDIQKNSINVQWIDTLSEPSK